MDESTGDEVQPGGIPPIGTQVKVFVAGAYQSGTVVSVMPGVFGPLVVVELSTPDPDFSTFVFVEMTE